VASELINRKYRRNCVLSATAFLVIGLLEIASKNAVGIFIGVFTIVISCMGFWRARSAGYLSVDASEVTVRTMFRTRKIPCRDVVGVSVEEVTQFTPRVMPVLRISNGKTYRLSEFFAQSGSYDPSDGSSIVTAAVHLLQPASGD
jgi:hypothetical protein